MSEAAGSGGEGFKGAAAVGGVVVSAGWSRGWTTPFRVGGWASARLRCGSGHFRSSRGGPPSLVRFPSFASSVAEPLPL